MAKNKHNKHKGNVAPDTNATPINDMAQPDKAIFDGGLFAPPSKSGSANVQVSSTDLLPIVTAQYTKLAHTATLPMPKTDEHKAELVMQITNKHYAIMPNGYMAFDVIFMASRHTQTIDTSNYKKGNGLQSYITAIGTTKNKTGKPSGLCAKLLSNGFTVIENQYKPSTRAFMGRMWVIRRVSLNPKN